MAKHGKRYTDNLATVDREREYSPTEAVALIKGFATGKLDETVEVHFRLGVNGRHADQQLRGTISLPHGTGRQVTVAVFAEGDKAREIAERKMPDLNANDLDQATKIIEGTARSMGVEVG